MADDNKKDVTKINKETQEQINKVMKETLGYQLDFNKAVRDGADALDDMKKSGYELLADARKRARIEKDIKKNAKDYFKYVEEAKEIHEDILVVEGEIRRLRMMGKSDNSDEIKYLKRKSAELKEQKKLIQEQLEKSRGLRTFTASIGKDIKKISDGYNSISKTVKSIYNFFDIGTMFKMLKTLKTTSMEMGILSNQSSAFNKNLNRASINALKFGVNLEEVAKVQGSFSDELGTTELLSQESLKSLAAMSKVTGMGGEAVGKMAAEMKSVGISAARTGKFVNQVMNDSHAMGLNSTKIIKVLSSNLKLLNRYNFKGGVKGLAKMVQSTERFGVNINMAAAMADKLFNIEGAVEMSAQLQVLGGRWSQLADPFKLMYMARNDMAGLTDAVIDAASATARFNEKTGEMDISALEMDRLRKVAEATGLNFEELAQSAKKAAQFTQVRKQIKYKFDDDTKKFIENTSSLDEKGRAKILIGMDEKYVDSLTESDKKEIEKMAKQKEDMEARAKFAVTFDEQLSNLISMLKQMALPVIEALNDTLNKKMSGLMDKITNPTFIKGIEDFAKKIPQFVDGVWEFGKKIFHFLEGVGKFIVKFPKLSAGLLLGIGALKWLFYGRQLGMGFNSVARVSGGAGGSQFAGGSYSAGKKLAGKGRAGIAMGKMAGGAAGGLLAGGINAMFADSFAEGAGNVVGGVIGGALGSLIPIPGIGTMIGAQLGSMAGGAIGSMFADKKPSQEGTATPVSMNDGVIFNQRDKFTKVNDGLIAGTNVNGNKNLARAIMSASAPGISDGDKNKLLNSSQNTNVSGNASRSMDINLSTLKIEGSIDLKTNGELSSDRELTNKVTSDPSFVRTISRIINAELKKSANGKN